MTRHADARRIQLRSGQPCPVLLVLALGAASSPVGALAQEPTPDNVGVTWDFETGDLRGWTPTGSAFRFQPTRDDNPAARDRRLSSNHQGRFWIGTFEQFQGARGQSSGDAQGDRPQGTLTSRAFLIPNGTLSFLVGGGSSRATRVELLVGDPIEQNQESAFAASGQDNETMRRVQWDLSNVAGQIGVIRILDESSGGWGHINVDDFRFAPARRALPPIDPRVLVRPPPPPPPSVRPTPPPPPAAPQEPPPVRQVVVPDLRNAPVEAARQVVPRLGLGLQEIPRDSDRDVGTVIDQAPDPGTQVPVGDRVTVVVAHGRLVPNLVGRDTSFARDTLDALGLRLGRGLPARSAERPGTVTDQDVRPGTEAPLRWIVNVTVAQGVRVPPVIGLDLAAARATLVREGLTVGEPTRRESSEPIGTVLSQRPEPGAYVPFGQRVDVLIAAGVSVPRLLRLDSATAVDRILNAGLDLGQVDTVRAREPAGTVVDQDPVAGEMRPFRSRVSFTLAVAVSVPDVEGVDAGEARRRLAAEGLLLGGTTDEPSALPTGSVIRQDPEAGDLVPLGESVGVVLAAAVPVPRVVDSSMVAAERLLFGARLRIGNVTRDTSTRGPGTVLLQRPAGGEAAPLDTPVDLVVAGGVTVPALVGLDGTAAGDTLAVHGLRAGAIAARIDSEAVRSVIEQAPGPGLEVALGTAVDLVLARWVSVPDLTGRDSADAHEIVVDSLLRPVIERRFSLRGRGTVLEQSVAVGTEVPPETAVRIVVARPVPWLPVGGGLAALLGFATLLVRRIKRPGSSRPQPGRKPPREGAKPGRPTIEPFPDPGTQTLESDRPPTTDREIRWRAVADPGEQTIDTPGDLLGEEPRHG